MTLQLLAAAALTSFIIFAFTFRYGNKVLALTLGRLNFGAHTILATLLSILTGFCIAPPGFCMVVEFLERLSPSASLAPFIFLPLLGLLLGIHLHNITYYVKRFEETYEGYVRTRRALLRRNVVALSFLAVVTVQAITYTLHRLALLRW